MNNAVAGIASERELAAVLAWRETLADAQRQAEEAHECWLCLVSVPEASPDDIVVAWADYQAKQRNVRLLGGEPQKRLGDY